MHELSLMTNIMDICADELKKHGATKLLSITVRYGVLSNVVADSFQFAFEALTKGSKHEGAKLILVEEELLLKCSLCQGSFKPDGKDYLYIPCPLCGEQTPYSVLAGEGIFLDKLEAE